MNTWIQVRALSHCTECGHIVRSSCSLCWNICVVPMLESFCTKYHVQSCNVTPAFTPWKMPSRWTVRQLMNHKLAVLTQALPPASLCLMPFPLSLSEIQIHAFKKKQQDAGFLGLPLQQRPVYCFQKVLFLFRTINSRSSQRGINFSKPFTALLRSRTS